MRERANEREMRESDERESCESDERFERERKRG